MARFMKGRKIHIAGALVGSVQRCTRCHTRIDGNRTWQPIFGGAPTGWKEGVSIVAGRHGMTAIDSGNAQAFAAIRPCGKAAR
jgi:hypothetical protein